MLYTYTPTGVCSREIDIELDEENRIRNIAFVNGCSGNTQGVAALAKGMTLDEVIARLDGIRCGNRKSSCPDQLAKALRMIREDLQSGDVALDVTTL